MGINRRKFLTQAGGAVGMGIVASACDLEREGLERATGSFEPEEHIEPTPRDVPAMTNGEWRDVRAQFDLAPDYIHMSALLLSSHPRVVREAIEYHRSELDLHPVAYLEQNHRPKYDEVRTALGRYLGAPPEDLALTDSTTMGVGMVYTGLNLRSDQEMLTTEHDYYVTHESLRLAAERTGASVRRITLYDDIQTVSADEIISNIEAGIRPNTRVLAMTWVHSSTGLKLPLREIGDVVQTINANREEDDRVLLCIDGVHGFGVEDIAVEEMNCDFFMAGCHKWLFGPRGTGVVYGKRSAWQFITPATPSFMDADAWTAWLVGGSPDGTGRGTSLTPGGFKPFEHQWALKEAVGFHDAIGKARIANRTHELSRQLKEGLAQMSNVTLYTPVDHDLSAGIVCFDVDGRSPQNVVRSLRRRGIIATTTPYAEVHARLTPSIRNTPEEIELVLREITPLA